MPRQGQGLTPVFSLFRKIVPAALLIAPAALPMPAQTPVPSTAVQAARMPQFASRLAHAAGGPASRPNAGLARKASRSGPPQRETIYDNGPVNGTIDAWSISFGYVVSDSVTLNSANSVSGFEFYVWEMPGDRMTSVDWSITSAENGGTVFGSGTVGGVNLTDTYVSTNQYGYNIDRITASGLNVGLNAGTTWLNLENATIPNGDPVYWDENSGAGCTSPGCPSLASENVLGTIPSESFSVQGSQGQATCFQAQGNLQIIHDFTPQQAGPYGEEGVVIDRAGNLYGTNPGGGDHGAGLAYRLSHVAGWLLDPLFSFFGGSGGGPPFGVTVGPNGTLFGGAEGGIQNCGSDGSQYCGLAYNLTPQPVACRTALCAWNENAPYRFSSESDGSGVINVSASDQQGNLYGTTSTGGTYGAGTVFKLTPSGGGWTKTTLYSFTGGSDGTTPTQVLAGHDGNLYGVAGAMYSNGIVFQLTPSGGQWTESVLYAFSGQEAPPASLVQDSAGNLYGVVPSWEFGPIFTLQKTSSGWTFSEYLPGLGHGCSPGSIPYDWPINLTIDAAGNLYGTGTGGTQILGSWGKRSPGYGTCFYNYIFKARYDSGGWHYQDLDFLDDTYFNAGGSLAVDTSGNLYGTTSDCGAYNSGTVWQVSP